MDAIENLLKEYTANNIKMTDGDIECFAQGIINTMKKDGLGIKDITTNSLQTYAIHENKKMQSFVATCLTRPEAKRAIMDLA